MLTEQRYEIILRLVNERKSITASELQDILETSESTVRRDITALHKAGKLIKVFGGAVALEQTVTAKEYTVAQKLEVNLNEKESIAAHAAALITDEDFAVQRVIRAISAAAASNWCASISRLQASTPRAAVMASSIFSGSANHASGISLSRTPCVCNSFTFI